MTNEPPIIDYIFSLIEAGQTQEATRLAVQFHRDGVLSDRDYKLLRDSVPIELSGQLPKVGSRLSDKGFMAVPIKGSPTTIGERVLVAAGYVGVALFVIVAVPVCAVVWPIQRLCKATPRVHP